MRIGVRSPSYFFRPTTTGSFTTTLFALHAGSVALTQPAGATAVSGVWQPPAVNSCAPTDTVAWKYVVRFGFRCPAVFHAPPAFVLVVERLASFVGEKPRATRTDVAAAGCAPAVTVPLSRQVFDFFT